MTTFSISSSIVSSDIEQNAQLITSSNVASYFFVNASFQVSISTPCSTLDATLQTGHLFHHNDYDLPSNAVTLYEGDDLLLLLDKETEDSVCEQNTIDYINEECDTDYTSDQLLAIYHALQGVIWEASQSVAEVERCAESALEADTHIYVLVTEREDTNGNGVFEQVSPRFSLRFDSNEQADSFIESANINYIVTKTDKETGLSEHEAGYSNF